MGRRILAFMKANDISNKAHFAEKILGLSRQSFHAWLYREMDAGNVAAKPILLCADALGTNPDYLLCITDDPRPATSLALDENQLIEAYRSMDREDRERLRTIASDWAARSANGGRSAASPFKVSAPTERSVHEPTPATTSSRKKHLTGG